MIIRPSTPQVLVDIVEELNREILPLLTDTTAQIRMHMITSVLSQCAGRAEQEIALMREESVAYRSYATRVAEATGDEDLTAAIDASALGDDLRLSAVSDQYAVASDMLATALEAALDAGLAELVAEGESLLTNRIATEQNLTELTTAGR